MSKQEAQVGRMAFEHFNTHEPTQLWRVEILKGDYRLIRYYNDPADIVDLSTNLLTNPTLTLVRIQYFQGSDNAVATDESPSVSQLGTHQRSTQE